MSNMIVRSSGGGLAVNNGPTVLGEREAKIPIGGKIRPGIKVLTSTALKHPHAKAIYDAGVAAGHKWDKIEKELVTKCNFDKSPLTPRNVQYFTVFREDFTNPETADQILEQYGSDVDGHRRLLRFPVIFPTDSWQANMPHDLRAYTRSELQYWSDYDQNGMRRCFTKASVAVDPKSQRAPRLFGGRPSVPRPDNGGVCDPEKCPQYQSGLCNLTGNLLFFIPGIPGGAAISLPFKSFYGMEQARQTMAMVAFLRGGRISGTHEGKPIFWITKKLQEVSMIDRETGKPKRVAHWIVTLEADIDMLKVFRAAEERMATAREDGALAAAALSAPVTDQPLVHDDDDHGDVLHGELVDPAPAVEAFTTVADGRRAVADLLAAAGITPESFSAWNTSRTGDQHWGQRLETLQEAHTMLRNALEGDIVAWKRERNLDAPF